jgi:hypothetical protein
VREIDPSAVRTRVEEIWNDVLEVSPDEAGATFFELGGQGISALRIVSRIGGDLGISVEVGEVFEYPSLEAFVRHVLTRARAAAPDTSPPGDQDR